MWQNIQDGFGDDYGWMLGGGGWLGMGLHGLFWILILTALIAAIVWTTRAGSVPHRYGRTRERTFTPGEILDERYARGEIGRDDYIARKARLGN